MRTAALGLVVLSGGLAALTASGRLQPSAGTLITGAVLVDGTGSPGRRASVRIDRDRVVAVGDLEPGASEMVVDASGLVLAPGFIDTHSHGDDEIFEHPDALAAVSQGITTLVGGQDGGSAHPLADTFARLERSPAAVNVASYVGHGTVRRLVMGEDFRRPARADELERMRERIGKDLDAGALGLSTGLEYDPGIYSTQEEVIELAKVAAAAGGRYISHIRSEDRYFWEAIEEILAIGQKARLPVQISHLKLAMRGLWGQAERLRARLDEARAAGVEVTADIYPYLYWQSTLTVLFPRRDFDNREEARFVLSEISPPDGLLMGKFEPEPFYVGKTLAEIAALRRQDPPTTLMEMIREAEALRAQGRQDVESVIGTSMSEPDLERLIVWPHANICTDGQLDGRHPRGFGTFPRVLGRYVRARNLMSLEEAIRKMTSLSASHMGFRDRGTVKPGMAADLVLLDPATVLDRSTTHEPHALSVGIEKVWVNGELVYEKGQVTGKRPGRVLRRS
jgi:N-acyl-D-amino-acid deacylase